MIPVEIRINFSDPSKPQLFASPPTPVGEVFFRGHVENSEEAFVEMCRHLWRAHKAFKTAIEDC